MANYLPLLQILSQESLSPLKLACAPFKAFATDFSSDIAREGSTLTMVMPTVGDAQYFDTTNGYVATTASGQFNAINLSIIHATVPFNDQDVASLSPDRIRNYYSKPLINKLIGACQSKAFSYVTSGNFPSNFTPSALDYGNLMMSGQSILKNNQVNGTDYAAILNPTTFANLKNSLKSLYHDDLDYPFYGAALQGSIGGSPVGADSNIIGFNCAPSALGLACRSIDYSLAPSPVEQVETITDPETQFTIQFSMFRVPQLGQTYLSARTLFGANVGYSGALVRIL